MRVAIDGTPLIGPKTGIGRYTYDLLDAMAVASPEHDFAALPISWRTAAGIEVPSRTNVRVVRRFLPAQLVWRLWRGLRWPPIERLVECDVFHATNYIGPPSKRVPLVATVHDLGFRHYPQGVSPAVRAMAAELPTALRRSAAIIAVSDFTAAELKEWLPDVADRVRVIHHGFRGMKTADAAPTTEPYALFVGTLLPRKNPELAIAAISELKRRGVKLRLVLAGDRDRLVDVDGLIRKHGLTSDDVELTGYVTAHQAAALLASARVFVFPSRYEGFGMPLLEAMSAGVPVVAARSGAAVEVAGDAALLVDPDDVEAMAGALETAATDEHVRADLTRRGRERLREFSWEQAARQTLDVYRTVIG